MTSFQKSNGSKYINIKNTFSSFLSIILIIRISKTRQLFISVKTKHSCGRVIIFNVTLMSHKLLAILKPLYMYKSRVQV